MSDMKLPFFIHLARATFPELYSVSDCTLRVTAKTLDDSGQVCPIAYQMLNCRTLALFGYHEVIPQPHSPVGDMILSVNEVNVARQMAFGGNIAMYWVLLCHQDEPFVRLYTSSWHLIYSRSDTRAACFRGCLALHFPDYPAVASD